MTALLSQVETTALARILPFVPRESDLLGTPIASTIRIAFCECGATLPLSDPALLFDFINEHGAVVVPPLPETAAIL